MKHVLMTGAAGGVGQRLRKLLAPVYPGLRLSDIKTPPDLAPGETFVAADLAVLDQVEAAVDGMEGIVHLGGHSVEGPWETILQANIVGCYNLFEAARRKGVKRVVFASSNHAVGFYPRHRRIGTDVTVRPDSRYGVSKAFGEDLGNLYAYKHGISTMCIRIGSSFPEPKDRRMLATWLSYDDLERLVLAALGAPRVGHTVVYGMSDNATTWWDNSRARHLGFRPQDSSEPFRAAAEARQPVIDPNDPASVFQGGAFVRNGPFE